MVVENENSGITKGKANTTTMPSTAVNAIEDATSLPSASITGATAAMAELPQIELPHAIKIAILLGKPLTRPMQ